MADSANKMADSATIHPPPGAGIPALRYNSCLNATSNFSLAFCLNDTVTDEEYRQSLYLTQKIVAIVVPLLFGIIVFVGLIGNALVSIIIIIIIIIYCNWVFTRWQ
jgi:ABC-type transport system involved in cytochrome bd biosynthesis fused ATPase/permease subunit